jgi:hypothetical protein
MRIRTLIFVSTLFAFISLKGQEYLVIDTTQPNLFIQYIDETMWNSPPCEVLTMLLDLDDSGSSDVKFTSTCYMGSGGYTADLSVIGINASLVADTMVIDSSYIEGYGEWIVDTFSVVEKFDYGDTIFMNNYFSSDSEIIVHIIAVPAGLSPGLYLYVDDWKGTSGYIAFRMDIDSNDVLGWIKMDVLNNQALTVEYTAMIYPGLGINENGKKKLNVFPNPARKSLSFANSHYDRIQIIDLSGKVLIDKKILLGDQTIDVGILSKGYYVIRFSGDRTNIHTYFIKQ